MRICSAKNRSCLISTVFLFAVALAAAPWRTWTGRGAADGSAHGGRTDRPAVAFRGGHRIATNTLFRYTASCFAGEDPTAASYAEYLPSGGAAAPAGGGFAGNSKILLMIGSGALVFALTTLNLRFLIRKRKARAESITLAELNRKLFTEIEERKAAQEALRKSEQKYRELIENINEVVFSVDDGGTMTYVSPAVKNLGGYDASEVIGQPFTQFVFPGDAQRARAYFEKLMRGTAEPEEFRVCTRSGEVRWIRVSCRSAGVGLQGTFVDITDRKWIEEILHDSEQKFRRVVEESPEGIVLADSSGVIVEWNRGEEAIVGINRDEAIGRCIWDVMHELLPPELKTSESRERIKEAVLLLILNREAPAMNAAETEILRPDGSRRTVQSTLFPIHTDKGCMAGSFTRDVTERKEAEERIKVSLKEKEILLQEVHHRVKNNLQVISSLLDLSRLKTEDGPSRDILTEARNKVYTMALIHSQLYSSERADSIDMAEYVRELAGHIAQMYASGGAAVTPLLAIERIDLTMNQAIPCALVLNELITNVYKHAFRDSAEGTLIVTMKKTGDHLMRIEVKDNGAGMPESPTDAGPQAAGAGKLGLRLVQSIVRDQLKGTLEMENEGGLTVRVTFCDAECQDGPAHPDYKTPASESGPPS